MASLVNLIQAKRAGSPVVGNLRSLTKIRTRVFNGAIWSLTR